MRSVALWKVLLIAATVIFCGFYLYPTSRLVMMSPAERAAMDPKQKASLEDKSLKLGLDLQGGMYLLLEVDRSGLSGEEAKDAVDRALEIIRNRVDQFGVAEPSIQRQGSDRILVQLPGLQDLDRAKKLIGQTALLEFNLVEEGLPALLQTLDAKVPTSLKLAGAEPATATGAKPAPGDSGAAAATTPPAAATTPPAAHREAGEMESLAGMVTFAGARGDEAGMVPEDDVPLVEKMLAAPEVQAAIPPDQTIAWGNNFVQGREGRFKYLYLMKKHADMSGAKISTASARPDPDAPGTYEVQLKFTSQGSRTFLRLTRKNVGRLLAIVLDGKVNSAPEIRSAIPGVASITGGFTIDTASDLAIVLRAGSLPAPLRVIEERTVGPSLGADSIRRGVGATAWGTILVALFMLVYYRGSGLLANIALFLNLAILLAVMAVLNATMTLPGIAGFALTAGMAVDANVLIFERIREEIRQKKTIRASIDKGYTRATVTIIDAHVTTLIASLVLLYYGTASIKGFAVTLTIGLLANLFTAIIVTRVVYDYITTRWKLERLSI